MAKLIWRCSCGTEFEETGNRKGWGKFNYHLNRRNKDWDENCRPESLIDVETGEVLIEAQEKDAPINMLNLAQENQWVETKERLSPDKSDPPPSTKSASVGPTSSTAPTNLEAIFIGQRVSLEPSIMGALNMLHPLVVDDDGKQFRWDPEGVSRYVSFLIRVAFEFIMSKRIHEVVKTSREQGRLLVKAGMVQALCQLTGLEKQEELLSKLEEAGFDMDAAIAQGVLSR